MFDGARGARYIDPMQVLLNGEAREIPEALTVAGLLAHLGVKAQRVAVEVNEAVVTKGANARLLSLEVSVGSEHLTAVRADGLILVCAGAGGHAGTLSPFALLGEVRRFFESEAVRREFARALSAMVIEVKAEIRVRPAEDGRLAPEVKADVRARPAEEPPSR